MRIVYLLYAVALFGGGFMGYRSAGSSASLIAGSIYAVLALAAAVLVGRNPTVGLGVGIATSVLVAGFFLYRLATGASVMVAAPAIVLSIAVLIASLVALSGLRKAAGG